jgi:F420-non-reducing hydrogenase small subunit
VLDQGAKFISALGSIIDSKDPKEIEAIISNLPDLASTLYRFSLPASFLQRSLKS